MKKDNTNKGDHGSFKTTPNDSAAINQPKEQDTAATKPKDHGQDAPPVDHQNPIIQNITTEQMCSLDLNLSESIGENSFEKNHTILSARGWSVDDCASGIDFLIKKLKEIKQEDLKGK